MRTIYLNLFFLLIASYACTFTYIEESITGNGNVVKTERQIHSFHGIKVTNGIDVYLTQGDKEKLVVIADENLHDVILTEVDNGVLTIKSTKNMRKASSLKIELDYEHLNSIKISSAGDVVGKSKLVTDDLEIKLSSAGNLDLEIEANSIDCKISSSGDAELKGATNYFSASLSSAGDLNAFDLISEECKVRVSSAGDAKVFATKSFDLEASSAGDIYYKGEGKVINLKTSSAGTIKKVN